MLFLFFAIHGTPQSNVTIDDIAVGIWSGYEMVFSRMTTAAKTWIRQFKHVVIYSDFFPTNGSHTLDKIAQPTKIEYVELGYCAKHLFFPSPWERAQPRFVKAMEDLYRRYPEKKWYLFVDDDSFPILRPILNILQNYDYKTEKVIGRFYCAWPEVVYGKKHNNQCLNFAQGGAGVLVSNSYFQVIADNLTACNNKYNDRLYAGSMRFAKCSQDVVGDGRWSDGRIVTNLKEHFHSSDPVIEIMDGYAMGNPANFHHLSLKEITYCYYGIRSDFNKRDGTNMFVDWTNITSRPFYIFPEPGFQPLHLRFGYAISVPGANGVLAKSTSPLIPSIYNDLPIGYYQRYGPAFAINVTCDDSIPANDIEQDYVENTDSLVFYLRMKCPEPEEYKW